MKTLAYRPLRAAVRVCADAADRVIATDDVLAPVVEAHLAVEKDRLRVIPNAVDLDAIDALASATNARGSGATAKDNERAPHGGGDSALLLAVGRLEANKGFHVLIEALARLWVMPGAPACHLVLVGDGPRRSALQRQAQEAGLGGQVHFLGRLPDDDVHQWYSDATLFVHPTLYEGSSLVTLEAMAHRCAVVATAAGGIPDKVKQGVTGWLVPPGNADALARAIAGALSNRARLPVMGEAGRAVVERKFSWTVVTDRLLDLYAETLRAVTLLTLTQDTRLRPSPAVRCPPGRSVQHEPTCGGPPPSASRCAGGRGPIGLWLRAPRIGEGMPYFYHPDEANHFYRTVRMLQTNDYHPYYFLKPTLCFYIRMPAIAGGFLWSAREGEITRIEADYPPRRERSDRHSLDGVAPAHRHVGAVGRHRYSASGDDPGDLRHNPTCCCVAVAGRARGAAGRVHSRS